MICIWSACVRSSSSPPFSVLLYACCSSGPNQWPGNKTRQQTDLLTYSKSGSVSGHRERRVTISTGSFFFPFFLFYFNQFSVQDRNSTAILTYQENMYTKLILIPHGSTNSLYLSFISFFLRGGGGIRARPPSTATAYSWRKKKTKKKTH